MHETRAFGASLYNAIDLYERNLSEKGKISLSKELLQNADADRIARWFELLGRYIVAANEIGVYSAHPLIRYGG